MSDICEPCRKDDHAWCYRHERMRWWVTCLCPKHGHRDDPDARNHGDERGRDASSREQAADGKVA